MSRRKSKVGKQVKEKPLDTGAGSVSFRSTLKGAATETAKTKPSNKQTPTAMSSGTNSEKLSDEDPIWRTIKKASQPLKSGQTAYGAFRQMTDESGHKTANLVQPSKPIVFPSEKSTNLPRRKNYEQADWSIGDAIRNRLRDAALQGNKAFRKTNLISNLSAGHLVDMDRSTADKFRRGKLGIEARLDLHGYTQDESMAKLARFIELNFRQGKRCLIVVTGKGDPRKGGGVLKRHVPEWLEMSPNREKILAISKAQPKDGGSGALYVLLKRIRA